MGRSNDALRKANDALRDFVALTNQEVVDVISEAIPTGTLSSAHSTKRPLNGMNELNVYLACTGANIAAADTLTFKFYIAEEINGVRKFNEIYQAANYTVLTTGVTADQVRKYSVTDTDGIIKSATHYSFATTAGIAMPALCYGILSIGRAHDIDSSVSITGAITIDSSTPVDVLEGANRISSVPAPVAVTATAQNITLVKAEIKNTGANIIYIRDSATVPTAADVNDYPLYAGEVMGLLTGVYSIVCGAGLTSTLNIVELV